MFIGLLRALTTTRLGDSLASNSKGSIKCVSPNNRPCQTRPTLIDIHSNEPLFYPFTVSINKCGGSCDTIDDPYAHVCVLNK